MLENVAYMLAIQNLIGDCDKTKVNLPEFITTPVIEDRDNVLNDILSSKVIINEDSKKRNMNLLSALLNFETEYNSEIYGVKLHGDKNECLAVSEQLVKRYLLKDIRKYEDMNISAALLRIPGAKKFKTRFSGKSNPQHCVLIPLKSIPAFDNFVQYKFDAQGLITIPKRPEERIFESTFADIS